MRLRARWLILLCAATLVAACTATTLSTNHADAAPAPPGATAKCRDGTYSFSQQHSGTCSHHGGVSVWFDGNSSAAGGGGSSSPALGRTLLLSDRSKTSGCTRGTLPDRRCSPGAYYSRLTKTVLCSASFRTGTIRNVPQSEKYAVEGEYGMPARLYGRTIEIDHIVPLELGGSNNIANLFPEPGSGDANYHAKDRLENRLHVMVCTGEISLSSAQNRVAGNWETLYKTVVGILP